MTRVLAGVSEATCHAISLSLFSYNEQYPLPVFAITT